MIEKQISDTIKGRKKPRFGQTPVNLQNLSRWLGFDRSEKISQGLPKEDVQVSSYN